MRSVKLTENIFKLLGNLKGRKKKFLAVLISILKKI